MTKQQLIARAAAQNAKYPQYQGHFDQYILVRIKRRLKTKMGVAFEAGELAIAQASVKVADEFCFQPGKKFRTVYSLSNQVDTSIPESAVTVL